MEDIITKEQAREVLSEIAAKEELVSDDFAAKKRALRVLRHAMKRNLIKAIEKISKNDD